MNLPQCVTHCSCHFHWKSLVPSAHGAQINFGDLIPYITYANDKPSGWTIAVFCPLSGLSRGSNRTKTLASGKHNTRIWLGNRRNAAKVFTKTAACVSLSYLFYAEQAGANISRYRYTVKLLQSMKSSGLMFSGISDPITVVRFPKIIMLKVFFCLWHKRRETVRLCTWLGSLA